MNSEICLLGSVSATRLGITNSGLADGLERAERTRPVCSFSFRTKVLAIDHAPALGQAHELLAHRVPGAPSPDRGDAVFRRDGRAVVPQQAVAQHERVGEAVAGDREGVDHLRLGLVLLVEREKRVVDHVAVVAGDVDGGPDRIDDLEIGIHDDAQHRLCARACGPPRRRRPARDPIRPVCRCVACMRSSHPTILHRPCGREIAPDHADNQGLPLPSPAMRRRVASTRQSLHCPRNRAPAEPRPRGTARKTIAVATEHGGNANAARQP